MTYISGSTHIAVLITLCIVPCFAPADIYRYTDEEGRVVYTNVPPKSQNRKNMKVITEHISVIPSRPMRAMLQAPDNDASLHRATASLDGLPTHVNSTTQQERDTTRRSILLEELNSEVKALSDAKKQPPLQTAQSLSNTATQPDSMQQQNIQSHERNINALQKELGLH